MATRRVVTAKNAAGKSVVVSDAISPREKALIHTPGFVSALQWTVPAAPSLPFDGADPMSQEGKVLFPTPGSSTFFVITFPPDSVFFSPDFQPELAGAEHAAVAQGLAELFEMDNPGMHTTPTLDYGVVLNGTITLELDDGETVELKAGDTFVQHGARHAWRNPTTAPATIAVVLIGASS